MQRVRGAGAKPSQHLAEQFAGFGLLAAEADAMTLQRLVSYPRSLDEDPIEPMTGTRLFEIRMSDPAGSRVSESLPHTGGRLSLSVVEESVDGGIEHRQIVRS